MQIRKNINTLQPDELARLRRAMMRAQEDSADSYEIIAGIHGWPLPVSCPHHSPDFAFLPWHRKYLLEFEAVLRRFEPDVTLPFWDWAGPIPSTLDGIPVACQPDLIGTIDVNPLSSAPMRWIRLFVEDFRTVIANLPDEQRIPLLELLGSGGWSRRNPQLAANLHDPTGANLKELEIEALRQTEFGKFSDTIEQPHDNLHGHVGFHMSSVGTSAFDPVFWLHHANIDRQWAIWQRINPNAVQHPTPTAPLVEYPGTTVGDMLDITTLGYSYEGIENIPLGGPDAVRLLAEQRSIDLSSARFASGRLLLLFDNLQMPMESSVLIRVFKDTPDASERMPTVGNPNFLGQIFLFGHGATISQDHHHGHPHERLMVPFSRILNLAGSGVSDVNQLTLVGVSPNGNRLALASVQPNPPRLVTQ